MISNRDKSLHSEQTLISGLNILLSFGSCIPYQACIHKIVRNSKLMESHRICFFVPILLFLPMVLRANCSGAKGTAATGSAAGKSRPIGPITKLLSFDFESLYGN